MSDEFEHAVFNLMKSQPEWVLSHITMDIERDIVRMFGGELHIDELETRPEEREFAWFPDHLSMMAAYRSIQGGNDYLIDSAADVVRDAVASGDPEQIEQAATTMKVSVKLCQ